MKRIAHLAATFVFATMSAAVVAYGLAHVAQYGLGVPGPALREQALTCAALIIGLVTVECLSSSE